MDIDFGDYLARCTDALKYATDSSTAWDLGVDLFGVFGPGFMSYGVIGKSADKLLAYKTNFTHDMLESFAREDLGPHDYVAAHCRDSVETLIAVTDVPLPNRQYEEHKLMIDAWARRYGIRVIVSQPFRERGLYACLSLFLTDPEVVERFAEDEIKRRFHVGAMLFKSTYDYATDPESYTDTPNMKKYGVLSHRERETLGWLANGLMVDAIAAKMGVKPVTVSKHLQSAKKKLNAKSRDQALAIALRQGLVHPEGVG